MEKIISQKESKCGNDIHEHAKEEDKNLLEECCDDTTFSEDACTSLEGEKLVAKVIALISLML